MKLEEFMRKAVNLGIDKDPRRREAVEKMLEKEKEKYEKMDDDKKKEYDVEKLWNPYGDTTILYDTKKDIKRIMVGIDIDTSELLVVDRLNEKKPETTIDLVLSHHPVGKALQGLYDVMGVQADMFAKHGLPINVGEGLTEPRAKQVQRAVYPRNTQKVVDAARLLEINLACTHSVADNHVQEFLEDKIDEKKPENLEDILTMLKEIPEFKKAMEHKAGPTIFAGKPDNRAGKIAVKMTGGTSPGKNVFKKLSEAGVGTLIGMHIPEDSRKLAEENFINIIISGHMASDSLGMNLLLDNFERESIEIMSCSGFIRVKR
ncbi:MAG: NGG1p interacting factor NIF3 [Candidatus Hodarchaeales archaeon]|jgi:hypothetical protein